MTVQDGLHASPEAAALSMCRPTQPKSSTTPPPPCQLPQGQPLCSTACVVRIGLLQQSAMNATHVDSLVQGTALHAPP